MGSSPEASHKHASLGPISPLNGSNGPERGRIFNVPYVEKVPEVIK